MSSKISLYHYTTGHTALQNVTIVVLFFSCALVLLGSHNFASGASSTPNVFEILSQGGDITFIGGNGMTKMVVIGAPSFTWDDNILANLSIDVPYLQITEPFDGAAALASVEIPHGATITGFECIVQHGSTSLVCSLSEKPHGAASSSVISSIQEPVGGGVKTLTESGLSHLVDRGANAYFVTYNVIDCTGNCWFYTAKITYTVPSGMVVGGEFYPVDNVSLVLAYGLVNSWWMAPIGIGIGVGVYLVRRKI